MNRQVWAGVAVGVVLAVAFFGVGRMGYDVAGADPAPVAQAPAYGQGEQAVVTAPEPVAGQEHAAFEWPAGVEYNLNDTGIETFKASLAPLWTWDGDVGTYVDGKTKVRILSQGGRVTGVEIIENASAIKDACLEAQLLYGISVDGAGVSAACTGMWTKEWAESQTQSSGQ